MDYVKRSTLVTRIEKTELDVVKTLQITVKKTPKDTSRVVESQDNDNASLTPTQLRSPAKKDLQLVQSSLENPLSSYISSRRSFTVESPHFGQFREPSTPQSLSKQPLHQQAIESSYRTTQNLMSIAAEGIFLSEDSKFTFQGHQNDSSARYDLKFDSFQQPPPAKKHSNIQIINSFCRLPRDNSNSEETKQGDPLHQQSTSEPQGSDFGCSREEEEDLEQLIASVSRKAAKRMNITSSNLFSSESTSHHASTESNSNQSERLVLATKALNKDVRELTASSQTLMRPVPYNYATRDGTNIFKDSASDLGQKSAEFRAQEVDPKISPLQPLYSSGPENRSERSTSGLARGISEQLKDKDSKMIDYEENLARGFKRKGISSKTLKENQAPSMTLKHSAQQSEILVRDKSRNSSKKKKSGDGVGDRFRPKVHVDVAFLKDFNSSRMPIAGEITPRTGSARKSKAISNIPLCLDISNTARSPKLPQNNASGLNSAKSASKLAAMKEHLVQKVTLMKSPTGDKSFNATLFIKTLQQQAVKNSNKSQTPLSKKELKKFMEKRKFTSTVVAESNASLLSRSAVRLKSKRKLNSELSERTTMGRQKTHDEKVTKKREQQLAEATEALVGGHFVRESKESTSSYLGELLHERGTIRSTLRASGELKMGEIEKARLRRMGDRHLELSKCLTSRAKPSLEIPLENSFVRNKVDHLRKCENTPERMRITNRDLYSDIEKSKQLDRDWPKESKSRLDSTLHRSGELTRKGGNLKIDIGSLSAKVLARIPFDS